MSEEEEDIKSFDAMHVLLHDNLSLADMQDAMERGGLEVTIVGNVTTNTGFLWEVKKKTEK